MSEKLDALDAYIFVGLWLLSVVLYIAILLYAAGTKHYGYALVVGFVSPFYLYAGYLLFALRERLESKRGMMS